MLNAAYHTLPSHCSLALQKLLFDPEMQKVINYVQDEYLSKPFVNDADLEYDYYRGLYSADWELTAVRNVINRPNHNIVHTLRVASLVPFVAMAYANEYPYMQFAD